MLCVRCKKEIEAGSAFCPHCGWKQSKSPPERKALKQANGMGSVYKQPGRRRKPWVAYKTIGWDIESDKQLRVFVGSFESKTDAMEALQRMPRIVPTHYNSTLEQVYQRWSKAHFRDIGAKGQESYENAWNSYLVVCKDEKMREVRAPLFQDVIDQAAASGKSYSTCDKIRQLCSQLCQQAMQEDLINKNYSNFIKMPANEKSEKAVFTQEARKLLKKNDINETARIILTLIYTGFRIGEFFAIENNIGVHINYLVDTDGGKKAVSGYLVSGSKTEAGKNRIMPIHKEILKYVVEWHEAGGKYLVQSSTGTKKSKDNFRDREFYPLLAQLGIMELPKKGEKNLLTPHSTRHTFIKMAIEKKVPPEVLKLLVGHEQYSTTVDFYDHKDFATLQAAIEAI